MSSPSLCTRDQRHNPCACAGTCPRTPSALHIVTHATSPHVFFCGLLGLSSRGSYLNVGLDAAANGGCLRLHPDPNNPGGDTVDVEPIAGRVVVFESYQSGSPDRPTRVAMSGSPSSVPAIGSRHGIMIVGNEACAGPALPRAYTGVQGTLRWGWGTFLVHSTYGVNTRGKH